ncbi:MAG: helix-turn-helix domain-containing protein [Proteobacteria bacterium]|nr:helix-turn-helix domain-containing protein [Pseudomonadota bacterium]
MGSDLRAARMRLGWDLPEVAASLRIRLTYLEALEEGRIADLPGNAYALGFLRTYARALGLDAADLSRRFKAEAEAVNRKTELVFPAPVPDRGVPAGAIVLIGALLAVGAYVGWYRLSGEGKLPAEVVTPVPARLAPLAEQVVPPSLPVASAPVGSAPATGQAAPAATPASGGSMLAGADIPAASVSPASAAAALPVPGYSPLAAQAPAQPGTTTAAPGGAASANQAAGLPPMPDGTRIVLRAKSDAWIQVRDRASGQVLLNRTLHPGETWPVPAKPGLLLTTGNAGGTEILVDGAVSAALGGPGVVRRDLPMDPDLIKLGKLAAAGPVPAPVASAAAPQPTTAASRPAPQ